jgi:transposase-like protein
MYMLHISYKPGLILQDGELRVVISMQTAGNYRLHNTDNVLGNNSNNEGYIGTYPEVRKMRNISERKKMAALELLKGPGSLKEVAHRVGVSTRTLYNWRKDPGFQDAIESNLTEMKKKVYESSGIIVELNALNNLINLDATILNSVNVGERLLKVEENQAKFKKILRDIAAGLKQLQDELDQIKKNLHS